MHAVSCDVKVVENIIEVEPFYLLSVEWNNENTNYPVPKAGQFFMLRSWAQDEAPLLSRPISVHSYDEKTKILSFLYEVKGIGTKKIAALKVGDTLRLTGPSGNGFPIDEIVKTAGEKPVAIVGGGIGVAPLCQLAKELHKAGAQVHYYGGYRNFAFGVSEITPLCHRVEVSTETGSVGYKGYVTDLIDPELYGAVCTCGPEIMMQKVANICMSKGTKVWVSKEEKMACGLGACLGCTCKSSKANGEKPVCVCKDGPVFEGSVVYDFN